MEPRNYHVIFCRKLLTHKPLAQNFNVKTKKTVQTLLITFRHLIFMTWRGVGIFNQATTVATLVEYLPASSCLDVCLSNFLFDFCFSTVCITM